MKLPGRYIIISFLLFFGISSLSGKTVDETALQILKQSPGYLSETYSLESVEKELATASNLPDPELGGEYLVMPSDVDNRWTAEISWGVEWPGVYSARKKEAEFKMGAASKALGAQRAEKFAEIKDLLLDYIQCRQKLGLLEELSQNNDTIYKLAHQAAKGGELTLLDLNKVKLEYANIKVAKMSVEDEQREITGNLSKIFGGDCAELLREMEEEFPPVEIPSVEEIAKISDQAPAVLSALAEAEAAKEGLRVTRMEALPSLSIGYKHAFEDGMHFNGATFGISIPIFSSRGKKKAALAEIKDMEFKAEATSREIEVDVAAIYRRLILMQQQIDEIAPIVVNVDYNATLLKAYEGELITLTDYITDRNYFTNAAIELVSLRHGAAKTLAQLQRYLIPSQSLTD